MNIVHSETNMQYIKKEDRESAHEKKLSKLQLAMKLIAILVVSGIGWFLFNLVTMLHVGVGG